MDYFPIFIDIRAARCVVIGGGEIALRKAEALARAGAAVDVIAPVIRSELRELAATTGGACQDRGYEPDDLRAARLVVAATDDGAVNRAVSEHARTLNIPVNVVDQPDLCTYIVPSIVDRSPLVIALSSGGASPVLLRLLRERLERMFPAAYGELARLAGSVRERVREVIRDGDGRRRFWERVLEGPVAEAAVSGRMEQARAMLHAEIEAGTVAADRGGEVWLVGAGPGDPDLLTLKALRLMQRADVVLHDNLVSPQILDLVRRDAERIYVGKRRSLHAVRQEGINALLLEHARAGKRVLRLKGGDPFVFGRGGEEIASLATEGIPFQVVPGITAANGCAAYAGIPLTHRDYAQSVRFVTGHLKDDQVNLRWPELAEPGQTLVVYMGLVGLEAICKGLIEHGRDPATPVALIERGTLPEQRVITSTLAGLAERLAATEVHAPTLLIIGEVVRLRDTLAWRESAVDSGGGA
ncbi:MAG: uroporphyrinogen-III C-methyltransferase [Gammaproteobacteria bacterium]|nr:uroporphyrinogen-III C-methyltransferase [Gammaproteobacteria bacterium]